MTEQPPATPDGAAESAARSGSLLRAEAHRFRSRRFIQVLLALAVLGWLVAVVIGLTAFGEPTAADFAEARQRIDQEVAFQDEMRQDCLDEPSIPDGDCPPELAAEDLRVEDFLSTSPFSFAAAADSGALGFGAVSAVLAFLLGATWIGAEWSTRSIVALLFWETRRVRLMAAKLTVLVVATAVLGVVAQAAWLAMAGILSAVAGDGSALPDGFWGDLLVIQARAVLLTVLIGLLGFGLANLVRNTGAALGIGFVYFSVLETALRILRPTWEPWLLSNNAVALLNPGGIPLQIPVAGGSGFREYLISNLQAGIYLGVVAGLAVGIGIAFFARRDVH